MRINLKDNATLKAFVKRAAPGYRKREVGISIAKAVTLSGGYWDGGTRSQWYAVSVQGVSRPPLSYPTSPFGPQAPTVEMVDGIVIIEDGVFCGKPATLHIYVTANDAAALGLTSEAA